MNTARRGSLDGAAARALTAAGRATLGAVLRVAPLLVGAVFLRGAFESFCMAPMYARGWSKSTVAGAWDAFSG